MAQDRSDRLELAIDDAARRLTHAEPTGFMAAGVVARLGERRPVHSRWLVAATAALVLVAAAAAALTILRITRGVQDEAPQSAQVRPPIPPSATRIDPAPTPAPRLTAPEAPSSARPLRATAVPEVPPTDDVSAVAAAWRARALPALPEPAPIVIEDSQPEALVVPLLELKPITTSPVVLEPIGQGRH